MPVSKRTRFEVLRRDSHACRYCGAMAPDAKLTIDHVVPVALGGGDEPSNLVTACADCNAGKSSIAPDSPIVEDVAADALRWSRAMAAAGEQIWQEQQAKREVVAEWLDEWEKWSSIDYLPVDFADSVARFHAAGLPLPVMKENAFRATGARHVTYRNQFRYFCGVCHNQIREMNDVAAALLATEASPDGA